MLMSMPSRREMTSMNTIINDQSTMLIWAFAPRHTRRMCQARNGIRERSRSYSDTPKKEITPFSAITTNHAGFSPKLQMLSKEALSNPDLLPWTATGAASCGEEAAYLDVRGRRHRRRAGPRHHRDEVR